RPRAARRPGRRAACPSNARWRTRYSRTDRSSCAWDLSSLARACAQACRRPAVPSGLGSGRCSPACSSPSSRCRDWLPHQFFRARACSFGQDLTASPAVAITKRPHAPHHLEGAGPMLGWALTFLVVALIAAVLGFGGIAGVSIEIAKIIFFVAVVLFLISAVGGSLRGGLA